MNKEEIYNLLDSKNISYEVINHKKVFTMEELAKINLPYKEYDAKNLFVRDDKKKHYYLITIKGNKKLDLKSFKEKYNTKRLSFASSDELLNILGLTPGSVTPFGLLNDKERKVVFYIDENLNDKIGVHPNDNSATVSLKVSDLINLLKDNNITVNTFNV